MRFRAGFIVVAAAVLVACGGSGISVVPATSEKVEGPNVKTLSHDALMAVLHECHQYGSSDDPRVKYTIPYCSEAQSAHSMEGYTAPSQAPVDPKLTPMH
jgi:hypothetical protein